MSRRGLGAWLLSIWVAGSAAAGVPFEHFDAGAAGHSWLNSYLLAMVSDNAYRDRVLHLEGDTMAEKFAQRFVPLGLEVVAFVEGSGSKTDTQMLVLRDAAVVVVAFSGSETHDPTAVVRDWLRTDARIRPREVDGKRIHRGFYVALDSVWDELRQALAGPLEDGLALWLTGHSLGGALASLAAYRLHHDGFPVAGVIAFASPKVGGVGFVADYEQRLGTRSQQWVTALDPIPRLPEFTRRDAYARHGVTHIVHANGASELGVELHLPGVPNPLAHRMAAYLNYLYRAVPPDVRALVPRPPPLCASDTREVGRHPDDGRIVCLERLRRKLGRQKCVRLGGEVVGPWCLRDDTGKFRYLARKLKGSRASSGPAESSLQ